MLRVFVGVESPGTEVWIVSRTGLFKTSYHNAKRVIKDRAYQFDIANCISITHEDYLVGGANASDPIGNPQAQRTALAGGDTGLEGRRGFVPRSFRSLEEDSKTYGYSENCPGCIWLQNNLGPRCNHATTGRQRFEDLMGKDEDDGGRFTRARERETQDAWLPKEVENGAGAEVVM